MIFKINYSDEKTFGVSMLESFGCAICANVLNANMGGLGESLKPFGAKDKKGLFA